MPELPFPQPDPARTPLKAIVPAVTLIASAALIFSIWAIFVGFHHSIFDFHAFRQAQTAISAEYMEHGGPFLRYETPLFGPPWSIPFEFPLYQKIVALLAAHLNTPLVETGRAVSIAFFFLCFFPLASILRRLGYKPFQVLAVLALFAISPLYIFVSRLFMIESTALFLSLLYIEQMMRLICPDTHRGDTPWLYTHIILAAIFGALAGLVKVTTFAPFLLLGAGLVAWYFWTRHRQHTLSPARLAFISLFCLLVPFLCTTAWTRFADRVKEQNPVGYGFTSSKLAAWNFGTPAERLKPANYLHFVHAVSGQTGSLLLLILLVLAYAVLVRRWNRAAVICLALYIFTPLIFFNLHLLHEYYPYSSAIFLIVGAGLLIADLLLLREPRAWIGFIFLVAFIAACIYRYHGGYYAIQRTNAPGMPQVAQFIDSTTSPGAVIVITGLDWSSELPFQSHRRAIMYRGPVDVVDAGGLGPFAVVIHNQGALSIPELVACDAQRGTETTMTLLHTLAISPSNALHAEGCDLYLRSPQPATP